MSAKGFTRPEILMLAALVVAELAATYETAMIYAALPKLYAEFDDIGGVTWLITAYLLAGAVFAVIASRIGDIFGRTNTLILLMGVIFVGSVVSSLTTNLGVIIGGRALQGAAAAVLPLALGIVREALPPSRSALAVGIVTGAASVGAGAGLMAGALLIDNFSWHSIFLFSAAFAAFSMLLIALWSPKKPRQSVRIRDLDIFGGILFAPALLALLLVVTNGAKWGLLSTQTLSLAVGAVVLLGIWIVQELRHPFPLIDVRLLAKRDIVLTNIIVGVAAMGAYQLSPVISLLMQQPTWTLVGLGLSATMLGLIKLPANASGFFGSLLSGFISLRRGHRAAAIVGAALLAGGWLFLTMSHSSLVFIFMGLVTVSFALPVLLTAASNIIIAASPLDRVSEATGLSAVMRTAFAAVGSQLIGLSLASSSVVSADGEQTFPSGDAFFLTFAWITACCVLALVLAFFIPSAPKPVWEDELVASEEADLGAR